jgi:DNA-binding transcriptional LysR family regulator
MDKLTALTVLCRVADKGSLAAAARDLGLSDAAVGKNLRELEAHLAVRLVNRTTRRLHLTDAGAAYLSHARRVLDAMALADASVQAPDGPLRGRLRIAAPMTLGLTTIAPALAGFALRHPEVGIDLDLDDHQVNVVQGGFDLAIRGAVRLEDSSLVARRLGALDRVLCASPGYLTEREGPVDPQDLRHHRCLVYTLSDTPRVWRFQRGGERREVAVDGPMAINNSLALASAAAAGLGIARLPRFAAETGLATGELVEICEGWRVEPGEITALTPRHREASRLVRAAVDHLVSALRRTASV